MAIGDYRLFIWSFELTYFFVFTQEGKLTSLEEFRLKKDQSEEQIRSLELKLKEKELELPQQMENLERHTLIRIEAYVLYYVFYLLDVLMYSTSY